MRGKLVTEEIEITDLESKTTTPIKNPNIALKPNVMDLGMKYVLRVAAWRQGFADGLLLCFFCTCKLCLKENLLLSLKYCSLML